MIKIQIIIFLLAAVTSCKDQRATNKEKPEMGVEQKSINDSLYNYFYKYEIEPSIIINNVEKHQKEISFSNHKIKWLDGKSETKIQIDDVLFSLSKAITLNKVWNESIDSIDFANNWDQIKYFKFNNKELLGIRMISDPCTGLGCSVSYFLLYDLHKKSKNYFGVFRTDNDLKLFHFNDSIDFISKSYNDYISDSLQNIEVIYQLYSLDENGKFNLQKNNEAKPYFIKHTPSTNKSANTQEKLEDQWFEKIK